MLYTFFFIYTLVAGRVSSLPSSFFFLLLCLFLVRSACVANEPNFAVFFLATHFLLSARRQIREKASQQEVPLCDALCNGRRLFRSYYQQVDTADCNLSLWVENDNRALVHKRSYFVVFFSFAFTQLSIKNKYIYICCFFCSCASFSLSSSSLFPAPASNLLYFLRDRRCVSPFLLVHTKEKNK